VSVLDIGFIGFLTWALYYVIFKALMHVVNVETRRNGMKTPAGVTGLLA